MADQDHAISSEVVEATIDHFTKLDSSGDKRAMQKMARRLGKEQPSLLQYAVAYQQENGDVIGEAAMFYCTLVWAIFDRQHPKKLHRLTQENLDAAQEIVEAEREKIEGLDERPVHERYSEVLSARQPHIYAKLCELIEEDVREDAMTEECASIIGPPTQTIIEAFDAAVEGRRPGLRTGPIVRDKPKVGRNEPCPCGSGKKYKKCHGKAA